MTTIAVKSTGLLSIGGVERTRLRVVAMEIEEVDVVEEGVVIDGGGS